MIVIGREEYICAVVLAAIPKVAATATDARAIFCICMVGTLAGRRSVRLHLFDASFIEI
jgi:hypothetical protein